MNTPVEVDPVEFAIAAGLAMPLPTPAAIARQLRENSAAFFDRGMSAAVYIAKNDQLWRLAARDGATLAAVSDIINWHYTREPV